MELVKGGFYGHLYRAQDLLEAGDTARACDELEEALALQPDSLEALSLQAAALFKLERFKEALQAYESLLEVNPGEPTLHVNLALVLIKLGRLDDAEAALRRGLSHGGDSKRLHGYLGLVYSKKREFEKALIAFNKAGSSKMMKEMEALMRKRQQGLLEAGGEGSAGKGDGALPTAIETAVGAEVERSQSEAIEAAQRRRRLLGLAPVEEREAGSRADGPEAAPAAPAPAVGMAVPWGAPRIPLERDSSPPLRIESANLLRITLTAGVIAQLVDVAAMAGALSSEPLYKRFKGRTTTAIFGTQAAPFCRLSGEGTLFLAPRDGARLYLSETEPKEKAFIVESALYAFTANLTWENGRIGTEDEASVDLITVTGSGSYVVRTGGAATELLLEDDEVQVPRHALLAWTGKLVPRVVPVPQGVPPELGPIVRLKGSGRVFLGVTNS